MGHGPNRLGKFLSRVHRREDGLDDHGRENGDEVMYDCHGRENGDELMYDCHGRENGDEVMYDWLFEVPSDTCLDSCTVGKG